MASGWEGAPYLQEIRPGAGFKTGDFVEEKFGGGATVERPTINSQYMSPKNYHDIFAEYCTYVAICGLPRFMFFLLQYSHSIATYHPPPPSFI